MNIVDVVIILLIALFGVLGFKRGFIKETTMFVGLILVLLIAFFLKNPVATFMFENFPFFGFMGIFKGVTVLNILLYELIAFFLVVGILLIILKIFTFFSGVIEKILNFTVVLGIPSKLLGTIVGLLEGYTMVFLLLFLVSIPTLNIEIVKESKLTPIMLNKTPLLTNSLSGTIKSFDDIYALKDKFKGNNNNDQINKEALQIMLKYKLVTATSIDKLSKSGKIKIPGIEGILEQYR